MTLRIGLIDARWQRLAAWMAAVILGLAVVMPMPPATAQGPQDNTAKPHTHEHGPTAPPAPAKEVPADKLLVPGPLPDISIGKADAPITIVEYASLTCGHCGRFHRELLPKVKAKYIDTGIARLIVREFPLERFALAAAMIARCVVPEKAYDVTTALFERQQQWLAAQDARAALVAIGKEFGLSEPKFDACMDNKELIQKVIDVRAHANKEFGVDSTPTFFINGKRLVGPGDIREFDEIIAPMIKK